MAESDDNHEEDKLFSPAEVNKVVSVPLIAWPTVILALTACCVQVSTALALRRGIIPTWAAVAINTIAIYGSFTPMHDASHGSVACKQYRWLNRLIGMLASAAFPVPFTAFKYLHLQHHKHTNEAADPDLYAGQGPALLLPLRWLTIEVHYYRTYLPNLPNRPWKEGLETILSLMLIVAAQVWLWRNGFGQVALYAWLLPGRLAIGWLACCFDYLPHRPHDVSRKQSIFRSTHVLSLCGECSWPLTWPLYQQNYHNIHHLAPFIPWYLYETVWIAMKEELMKKGTQIKSIF